MNITELRLNNIVNVKGSKEPRGVTVEDFRLAIDGENPYLTPIALNEEWLIKFGFDKRRNFDYGPELTFIYYKNGIKYTEYSDHYELYNCALLNFRYVHQLQNLYFALTGKELLLN